MNENEALVRAYSEICPVFSRYFRADISFRHLECLALCDVASAISFTRVLFIITYVAGGLISNFLYHTEGLSFSVLRDISFLFLHKNTTW